MFEEYKARKTQKAEERKLELRETELTIKQNEYAIKQIEEAGNVVIDHDLATGWSILGQSTTHGINQQSMLDQAFKLYHTNLHARNIIRTLTKFTFGKGPLVIPEDEDPDGKVKETWEHFKKINKWNLKEKEVGTRTFRDGEVFNRIFRDEDSSDVFVRFVRAQQINNPKNKTLPENTLNGIQLSTNDREDVIAYYRTDAQGNQIEKIDAEDMIHIKILSDSDQRRGISILRVCAKTLAEYEGWLQDRIYLNKVRSAIALIRNVKGGPQAIKTIRDENLSTQKSENRKAQKQMRGGSIITASSGIEYQMLSPNINASDVVDDGRAMLLSIAAAMGFPEMIFTSDYSNANYSSTLIAQNPFVREIEDWQDFFSTFYKELHEIVIEHAIKNGDLLKDTKTGARIEFPPMIASDIESIAKAFEILFRFKVVSKKTWQQKMGLDNDIEKAQIDEEEEEFMDNPPLIPGQPNPVSGRFNLPSAPINQFANKIKDLAKDGNMDEVLELVDFLLSEDLTEEQLQEYFIEESEKETKEELEEKRKHEIEIEKIRAAGLEKSKPETTIVVEKQIPEIKNEITVEKQAGDITIQPQKIDIDATTKVDSAEINIENRIPEQPPAEINIENQIPEQKAPIVNIENTIDVPETKINIENKIEKEDKPKTKKTIQRDEEGNVTGIIEE